MAGGGANIVNAMNAVEGDTSPAPAALGTADMQAMANQKQADAQRAAYLLSSTPTQQYYNPAAQQPVATQSATLRVPGYQGVRNPFTSPYTASQPTNRTLQAASQVSDLLNQTNQYKQNYAAQLYQAQQANQMQLSAMQKAYQDKMAADKAAADAAKAKQDAESRFPFGIFGNLGTVQASAAQDTAPVNWNASMWGASGGLADLQKGFKR